VADHLEKWLNAQTHLKVTLDDIVERLWEQSVIGALLRLSQEGVGDREPRGNVLAFADRKSA
jgi:hypothetical protein